jgi:type II secretory pathway component PulM
MKQLATIAVVLLLGVLPFRAANQPPSKDDQELASLLKELQVQNAAMAQNQAAIEAKLATVAEAIRQARVLASRGVR